MKLVHLMQASSEINYSLKDCQVRTPQYIVKKVWSLLWKYRRKPGTVVDFGAGDGRFSEKGTYNSYLGFEIDKTRLSGFQNTTNAKIIKSCAFNTKLNSFDVCIGNPPYVKHHDVDKDWLKKQQKRFQDKLGVSLGLRANLFVYFMCLALEKTSPTGIVALVIPFEWVSRPSTSSFRDFLRANSWNVDIYRLNGEVFEGVLTTACVTIVDKRDKQGEWRYFDVESSKKAWKISKRSGPTGTEEKVLDYQNRGSIWALRGLSPGTQKVFTLTDGERIHYGLALDDVVPCVTSLKPLPKNLETLSTKAFKTYYQSAGAKCWLIRSYEKLSKRLQAYLDNVPEELKQTATCLKRSNWYAYPQHPVPRLLYGAGFVSHGPKVTINSIGAVAVGSAYGIHSEKKLSAKTLRNYLLSYDFEKKLVHHAASLKKVEVKQMNGVLNEFTKGQK